MKNSGIKRSSQSFGLIGLLFSRLRKKAKSNSIRKEKALEIVSRKDIGVSFSLLACRDYGVNWEKALQSTIDLGFKRFRLMSYWSFIESRKGVYDFDDLDKQISIIAAAGGRVSLSIGMRQPRWPEAHVPVWAKAMKTEELTRRYIDFHRAVITHYKDEPAIESWQLENEFWLRSFGDQVDFSRSRLVKEFELLREMNPERPIIMTLARVLSLPLRRPTPDIYGTSIYRVIYNAKKEKYTYTWAKPWVYKLKKNLIKLVKNRPLIVHELQTEPWGPKANWEMSSQEQFESIDKKEIKKAVAYADKSGINYIDMWGAEWWYWRQKNFDDKEMKNILTSLVKSTKNNTT